MATLALSVAGQFVGGAVGGPIGATIGRALGALAGAAIDSALFGEPQRQQAVGRDTQLQGSSEGGPIPRLYGWSRLTGNIIWATELERIEAESSGAKGSPKAEAEEVITANFAVALCEGEVQRLGRIWADGQLLETAGLTLRFYRGTQSQLPDSLIEAKQGTAPAYRGLCYLVFERLPIGPFGNRIPNISVELCRVVGELEPAIRAVTIIPGATEFGYDPAPRVRVVGPGTTANENTHGSSQLSDWTLSIDELQALCPNLTHVSLVVAWFGDDLRCGSCTIRPKVEDTTRAVDGTAWVVSGVSRAEASVVSSFGGGPAYGGTPSDGAVLAAIADLKARGIGVTLYPIVMMDVPADNGLVDPYTGVAGQSAYPWRGRITCSPAPGRSGTPDKTSALVAQVGAFVGTATAGQFSAGAGTVNFSGSDWGYRRMVLHYARLAQMAGGVDALLIGSEMRAMTTLRDAGNGFPFVWALVALAADVRSIVGTGTKTTYAADWSEFSGLQPADAPGDKFFHLDPLWASADIDAVGIDNYMPLADWRDGNGHADAVVADNPHDVDYLQANIAGGEGYDWYYASDAARVAGTRSAILDVAYDEPWVWRFKDLEGWWRNAHHDRIGGVRSAAATAWVPQGKPIWLTELGCGAVDKGANAPNAFGDAKSSEDARPFFSTGAPDALVQRQFLRAHLGWWRPEAGHNPVSGVYGGAMLDPERIYLWTWDARPYPAFPSDIAAWADGTNHATGHWLTGRLGAAASDEMISAVGRDYGFTVAGADALPPLVHGMRIDGVVTARDALAALLAASGLSIHDGADGLRFERASERLAVGVERDGLLDTGKALTTRRRPDPSEALGQVVLSYLDREQGYLTGTATATRLISGTTSGESTNLVLDLAGARHAAERALMDEGAARQVVEFSLPPSRAAVEIGDVIRLDGVADGPFEVTEIRDTDGRRLSARALAPMELASVGSDRPQAMTVTPPVRAIPIAMAAHLPPSPETPDQSRLALAAFASPWPGEVVIADELTGLVLTRLQRSASVGELVGAMATGPEAVWDNGALTVRLYAGHLSSKDEVAVLAGGNRIAVQKLDGAWEVLGFGEAVLLSPGVYRLGRLLRGQEGTAAGAASSGAPVMVLDDRVVLLPVPSAHLGEVMALRVYAGAEDLSGQPLAADLDLGPLLALSPVHLRAVRDDSGDVSLSWTRRSRADANGWAMGEVPLEHQPEEYRVNILDGDAVVRSCQSATPSAVYAAAQQLADFGGAPAGFVFTIAQMSPVLGPGLAAQGAFHG